MTASSWRMLIGLSILWGGSFFFYKVLVAALPPFTVVLGRLGFAALALNLILLATGERMPRSPRVWGGFLVLGFFNNALPFCLFAWSELKLTSGMAAILNATTPVFAVLLASTLKTGERMTPGRATAVLFGFLGVIVLVGPNALAGSGHRGELLSEAACLGAALSYAIGGFYGRRFSGLSSMKVATGQVSAAALLVLPMAAIFDRFWTLPAPTLSVWGALAGISLICTAAAYVLFFTLLKRAGATNLLLVTFLVPVSALSLGRLLLHEPMAPTAFAGMALIGLSLAALDGRPAGWLRTRLRPA
jgi:drug/metabolite transporter (DMT)-like permease